MRRTMILTGLLGFGLPFVLMLATWAAPDLRLADELIALIRPAIDIGSVLRVQP